MIKICGTAKFADLKGYIDWLRQDPKGVRNYADSVCKEFPASHNQRSDDQSIFLKSLQELYVFLKGSITGHGMSDLQLAEEKAYLKTLHRAEETIQAFVSHSEEYNQSLNVGYWSESWAYLYMGNPKKGIVIFTPQKWLSYTPAKDWSDFTPEAVRQALGVRPESQDNTLLPLEVERALSPAMATKALENQKYSYAFLQDDIKSCQRCEYGDLAEMKEKIKKLEQEMYECKEQMLASLNAKRREMEQQMAQMEDQIFLLDAQIYTIICRMGDAITFAKLRCGKNAPSTEPIVIHQKLRFLDEELGLLASLYQIQWNEIAEFERFLKFSPEALDTFAPQERCVVLVRLSRTGTLLDRSSEYPYANILQEYEYYHGKTVGIIIRNGENLYLGWTDDSRVHIDDDLIISSAITKIEPAEMPKFTFDSDRDNWEKEERARKRKIMDGLVSRSYIYNILQGVVESSDMLPLPPGVKLNKQSQFVKYSVADKWLTDNRFDGFDSIIKKVNERVQVGDALLTTQSLLPEHYRDFHRIYDTSRAWENTRGRGEANRTHDVCAEDCTIYLANVVEYDDPVEMVDYDIPKPDWQRKKATPDEPEYYFHHKVHAEEYDKLSQENKDNCVLRRRYTVQNRHVFVSLKKSESYSWDGYTSNARANFELYRHEYINLTYLNSVWLTWCITNRKFGGWSIAGKEVSYAHGIRYLKTALDFVRKREAKEKEILDKVDPTISRDTDWPLVLSEWKIGKGVRAITPYQAKRFARWWKERHNEENL